MKNKKTAIIIGIIVAIVVLVGFVVAFRLSSKNSDKLNNEIVTALEEAYGIEVTDVYVLDAETQDSQAAEIANHFGGSFFSATCASSDYFSYPMYGYYDEETGKILASSYPYYKYHDDIVEEVKDVFDTYFPNEDWSFNIFVDKDLAMVNYDAINSYEQFKEEDEATVEFYNGPVVVLEIVISDDDDYPYTELKQFTSILHLLSFNYEMHFFFESDYEHDDYVACTNYVFSYPSDEVDSAKLELEEKEKDGIEYGTPSDEEFNSDKAECDEELAQKLTSVLEAFSGTEQFKANLNNNYDLQVYSISFEANETVSATDLAGRIDEFHSNFFINETLCSDFATNVYYSKVDFGRDGNEDFIVKVTKQSKDYDYNRQEFYFIFTKKGSDTILATSILYDLSCETNFFSINSAGYVTDNCAEFSQDYFSFAGLVGDDGFCTTAYTCEELWGAAIYNYGYSYPDKIDNDTLTDVYGNNSDENLIFYVYTIDGETFTVVDVDSEIDEDDYNSSMAKAKKFVKQSTADGFSYVSFEKAQEAISNKESTLGITDEIKNASEISWILVK